jgi:hypothetical protein
MLVSLKLDADFSRGVHTQQGNRHFPRPTPTPQHERTGVPMAGLRPQEDHAPRYRGRRFSLEAVMNSIRNGLGMRETEIVK